MAVFKQFRFLLVPLLLSGGCISSYIVPSEIKRNLSLCYDGKALETPVLRHDGYYQNTSPGSIQIPIVFFEDGICVYQVTSPDRMPNGEEGFTSVKGYIERMARKEPQKGIPSAYLKGLYEVKGDTLIMQVINDVRGGMPTWMGREYQFRVLNKQKLQFIRLRNLDSHVWIYRDNSEIYDFTPLDTLPSSYIWLMEKDWFWCEPKGRGKQNDSNK